MAVKKTHQQFLLDVSGLVGEEYSVLSEYKAARFALDMRHNKCGHDYHVRPNDFLNGKRCPKCSNINRKMNQPKRKNRDKFVAEVSSLVGDEYSVVGEYTGALEHTTMIHNACGFKYPVAPAKFLTGRRCPKCQKEKMAFSLCYGIDKVREMVHEVAHGDYELLGDEYQNIKTKMAFRHKKCGGEFEMTCDSFFFKGSRCVRCKESRGERLVSEILKTLKIKSHKQYKFEDCKDKRPLPFDFAIPFKSGFILIEYDGIQHFKPVEIFGGEKGFKDTKRRDAMKDEYCDSREELYLIRIPCSLSEIEVKEKLVSALEGLGALTAMIHKTKVLH